MQLSHTCLGSASTTADLPQRRRGFGHPHELPHEVLEDDKTAFQLVFQVNKQHFQSRLPFQFSCEWTSSMGKQQQ